MKGHAPHMLSISKAKYSSPRGQTAQVHAGRGGGRYHSSWIGLAPFFGGFLSLRPTQSCWLGTIPCSPKFQFQPQSDNLPGAGKEASNFTRLLRKSPGPCIPSLALFPSLFQFSADSSCIDPNRSRSRAHISTS